MSTSPSPWKQLWPKRSFAFAVDVVLTLGLSTGLAALIGFPVREIFLRSSGVTPLDKRLPFLLGVAATWLVYRGVAESGGRTVGKWLAGLEVEGPQGEPGFVRALARAVTCIPNVLAEAFGSRASFDTLLGVTIQEAPRLRWGRGLGALLIWGGLAVAGSIYGLRPTFVEMRYRFYETECYFWCSRMAGLKNPRRQEMNTACEDTVAELIRMKNRGDVEARLFLQSCPHAQTLELTMEPWP
jgi:hypothetical protein